MQWVKANEPDVLCLQETKVEDKNFPSDVFADLGYKLALYGQRTCNWVAVLSRLPLTDVARAPLRELDRRF